MVTRVFGYIDGIEVVFKSNGGDSYILEFPRKLDSGNYIVEVYAEDGAGNVSYCSKLICTIDPSGACVHITPARFFLEILERTVQIEYDMRNISLEVIPPKKCRGD